MQTTSITGPSNLPPVSNAAATVAAVNPAGSSTPLDLRHESLFAIPRNPPQRSPLELSTLLDLVRRYDQETGRSVRLVPTEGLMSPLQKLMYESVQNERYLHAPPENHDKAIRYPDIGRLQEIYHFCRGIGGEVLGAKHVFPDPLSGMHVMWISILALSHPGDLVLTIDPADGGHENTPRLLADIGRRCAYLPFDRDRHVVNVAALDRAIVPTIIYLNHSNCIYPHDLKRIKARFPSAHLIFDASQVLGLIAGNAYPNPLKEGADVLIGSTHKSLNGPQKAVIATNAHHLAERLESSIRLYTSNNHPADVAALAVCFLEAREFGAAYASALLENARTLNSCLAAEGVRIYPPRAEQHPPATQHVWIDCAAMGWNAEDAVKALYKAGIVANTLFLPLGGPDRGGAKGLRLGTTEVTRLGMGAEEMKNIASEIAAVLLQPETSQQIAGRIKALRARFDTVQFCFQPNGPDLAFIQKLSRFEPVPPRLNFECGGDE